MDPETLAQARPVLWAAAGGGAGALFYGRNRWLGFAAGAAVGFVMPAIIDAGRKAVIGAMKERQEAQDRQFEAQERQLFPGLRPLTKTPGTQMVMA